MRLLCGSPACSWGGRGSLILPFPAEQPRSLLSGDVPASQTQILADTPQGLGILKGNFFLKFKTFHLSNNNGSLN